MEFKTIPNFSAYEISESGLIRMSEDHTIFHSEADGESVMISNDQNEDTREMVESLVKATWGNGKATNGEAEVSSKKTTDQSDPGDEHQEAVAEDENDEDENDEDEDTEEEGEEEETEKETVEDTEEDESEEEEPEPVEATAQEEESEEKEQPEEEEEEEESEEEPKPADTESTAKAEAPKTAGTESTAKEKPKKGNRVNVSALIRDLADEGKSVGEIAEELGAKYQHVHNVVSKYKKMKS